MVLCKCNFTVHTYILYYMTLDTINFSYYLSVSLLKRWKMNKDIEQCIIVVLQFLHFLSLLFSTIVLFSYTFLYTFLVFIMPHLKLYCSYAPEITIFQRWVWRLIFSSIRFSCRYIYLFVFVTYNLYSVTSVVPFLKYM